MSRTQHLSNVARAYADCEGLSLSTVSTRVLNDGKKLSAIDSGAGITVRRLERALVWFSDNWPANCDWPPDVPRP